jgi:hypothetical protein
MFKEKKKKTLLIFFYILTFKMNADLYFCEYTICVVVMNIRTYRFLKSSTNSMSKRHFSMWLASLHHISYQRNTESSHLLTLNEMVLMPVFFSFSFLIRFACLLTSKLFLLYSFMHWIEMAFSDNNQMGLHQWSHLSQTNEQAPSFFLISILCNQIEYIKEIKLKKKKIKRDSSIECHFLHRIIIVYNNLDNSPIY